MRTLFMCSQLYRLDLRRVAMVDRQCVDAPARPSHTKQHHKTPRSVKAGVLPLDHSSSPFIELGLTELWKGSGRCRVRQHVNPLKQEFQTPTGSINWAQAFEDPTLPLIIDLGCGPGRFLMLLHKRWADERTAAASPDKPEAAKQRFNFLGVEIREPLVDRANEWASRLGFKHCIHYIYSNATISLAGMMKDYPGQVDSVYIQFPDPHFKKRHRKRRIFQPDLVYAVRDLLRPGGHLFLQSDIEMASSAMRNCFEFYAYNDFELAPQHAEPDAVFFSAQQGRGAADTGDHMAHAAPCTAESSSDKSNSLDEHEVEEDVDQTADSTQPSSTADDYDSLKSVWATGGWLKDNPLGVPTEREHYVLQQGLPVYRVLLVRKG